MGDADDRPAGDIDDTTKARRFHARNHRLGALQSHPGVDPDHPIELVEADVFHIGDAGNADVVDQAGDPVLSAEGGEGVRRCLLVGEVDFYECRRSRIFRLQHVELYDRVTILGEALADASTDIARSSGDQNTIHHHSLPFRR